MLSIDPTLMMIFLINTKCMVVLFRADVTVTGKWCCVTMQLEYCDSVAKSGVTLQCRPSSFERSIKQCMESVIAFYQNVRYDNDNL